MICSAMMEKVRSFPSFTLRRIDQPRSSGMDAILNRDPEDSISSRRTSAGLGISSRGRTRRRRTRALPVRRSRPGGGGRRPPRILVTRDARQPLVEAKVLGSSSSSCLVLRSAVSAVGFGRGGCCAADVAAPHPFVGSGDRATFRLTSEMTETAHFGHLVPLSAPTIGTATPTSMGGPRPCRRQRRRVDGLADPQHEVAGPAVLDEIPDLVEGGRPGTRLGSAANTKSSIVKVSFPSRS